MSALIGREIERRLLVEATTSPPGLIFVEGEAGVGKTALVRAALSDPAVGSLRVVVGHCHRLREPFPLGPVLEALCGLGSRPPDTPLSPLAGALRPVLPELAAILPVQPAPTGDPGAERHRVFRALRELLAALGPAVCVLEDLHWADESTLELLAFLAADPPDELSLVLTYNPEDLPSSSSLPALTGGLPRTAGHATIRVPPLSVDEVAALSCARLDTSELPAGLVQHLHALTAGIPFALEEMVRLHHEQLERVDEWRTVEELGPMAVPPAVRRSVLERMASLSRDARRMTQAAAVLAVPAGEDLIARVGGLSQSQGRNGLAAALSAAVLEERAGGLYGFLHALAAQSVYEEIPAPERRWLHDQAVQALEARGEPYPLAPLAHHLQEAGRSAEGARYAEAAADAASAIGDDRSAARLLEQALGAAGVEPAARVRIAIKLGAAARQSVDPARAIGLLEHVRDGETTAVDAARGELTYAIARLRYQTGGTGPWREEMERAVAELRHRPAQAAEAMVTLAWPVVGQGDVATDLGWLERATEAAARAGDADVQATVAGQRAAILACVGDPRWRRAVDDIPRRERSVSDRQQRLWAHQSLSGTAIALGHFGSAEAFLAEVGRLLEELPHVSWGPWRDSARASLDWRTGRWEGLEQRLSALSESGAGGPGLAMANEIILAALLLSRGRVHDAEHRFQAIIERAEPRGWMGARTAAATGLARIRLARGEARAAAREAAGGVEVLERKGIWIWGRELVPVAVRALLAAGDLAAAETLTRRFSQGCDGRDAPAAQAGVRFCRASMAETDGRYAAAARGFARAEEISRGLPAPYEAAVARTARARCLLADGDDGGATMLLSALEAFDSLGARWDVAQVRAELRAHGISLPSRARGGRRPYGDELSPREKEVAQLAGMGRKNREIAETLFISTRTVETHVAAALRKLGAGSREALASTLDER